MVWFKDKAQMPDFAALQQVRAYWEALRRDGAVPRREDLNPRGIASALEQVFLLEQIAPNHGRIRLAGMGLHDLMGMDVRGMPVTTFLEAAARAEVSAALGPLFKGEAILDLWLEAPRGIGRPALSARMMLLPLTDRQGGAGLALGCLCHKGETGRTPRRFGLTRLLQERMHSVRENAPTFAEPPAPFRTAKDKPYLRLVSSR